MMSRRETNSTTKMKIKNSKKKNKNKNNKLIQYRVRGGLRCIDGARWTNNFAINVFLSIIACLQIHVATLCFL